MLVGTLYNQPASMWLSAVCGTLTSLTAAYVSGDRAIAIAAGMLIAISCARLVAEAWLRRRGRHAARLTELIYELGTYTYSVLIGCIAALTVARHAPSGTMSLVITNAVGYAMAVAARNAGRPAIAIGQMVLVLLPVMAALLARPELQLKVLAVSMLLLAPAMASITLNVFRVLRRSIAAAETSQRLADRMRQLARTDSVTGLLNRGGISFHLVEKLSRLTAGGKLALMWIDLDRFKEVNDTLGHQAGDRVLTEVGRRLQRCAPPGAHVARFGGDEFILAANADSRAAVAALVEAVLAELNRPLRLDDERLDVGCSIGVAVLPEDGTDIDAAMKAADLALHQAKQQGGGQAAYFEPKLTRALVRRKEIESELRLALQRDELSVFFQPIIDLTTGRIRAFEALVRWFHPEKGELRPDEFVPLAEETGAIITLGNWITLQAAKVAAGWPEDITVAVNLSPLQLRAPGAALGILSALREARLAPTRLELEITETVLLEHGAATEAFIAELTAAGVRFALDDFGTGYSSLGYLNKYPFSKLKVDRSFVSGIGLEAKKDAIIRAVAGMGSALGLEVVAEGIETIDQAEGVRQAGCTLGQGYYFSRPVPAYMAAMLIAEERRASAEAMITLPPRRALPEDAPASAPAAPAPAPAPTAKRRRA